MDGKDRYRMGPLGRTLGRRRMLGMAGALTGAAAFVAACGGGGSKSTSETGKAPELKNQQATVAAGEQPKYGGVGKHVTSGEPPDLDPRLTLSFGLHNWLGSVMNRVVRTVHGTEAKGYTDFTLKPDLAESWEQPADLMSVTFKVRQGVAWHNKPPVSGRELTSEDIKNTFEFYAGGKGSAHAAAFQLLERVETPDKYTAKFVLKQPFAGLLEVLTVPTQWVFAQEIVDKEGDLKKTTVGTGPFVHEAFERGTGFRASKNPNYFVKGQPYMDGLELATVPDASTRKNGFRAGQFDALSGILPNEVDELAKSIPGMQSEEQPGTFSTFGFTMNQTKPPWNDVRVRRAVSMAIDRKAQVQSIFQDHGILGWGIPYIFFQDTAPTEEQLGPWWKYNVAEAKKLMEAAGYKDGFKDTITYFEYNAAMKSQVELVQALLKANLNVDLTIKPIDYTTWFQWYTSHKWEGTAWGFQIGSSSTIDDFCYQNLQSKSVANYWYIADDQIDNLAEKIRTEADNQKKKVLIKQMFDREQDIAARLWQPSLNALFVAQPYVRGMRFMALRGAGDGGGYGGATRAQVWLAK